MGKTLRRTNVGLDLKCKVGCEERRQAGLGVRITRIIQLSLVIVS